MNNDATLQRLQGFAEFYDFMPEGVKFRLSRLMQKDANAVREYLADCGRPAAWFDALVDNLLDFRDTITADRVISGSCTPASDLLVAVNAGRLNHTEAERAYRYRTGRKDADLTADAWAELDFIRSNDI